MEYPADVDLLWRARIVAHLSSALVILSLSSFIIALFGDSSTTGISWLTSLVAPILGSCGVRYRSRWMIIAFAICNVVTTVIFIAVASVLAPRSGSSTAQKLSFDPPKPLACELYYTDTATP